MQIINVPSINDTVLDKIVNERLDWVEKRKGTEPLGTFEGSLRRNSRNFREALRSGGRGMRFIMECKKASPSKGMIRSCFDPTGIARTYTRFASAISVLANEAFFQGKPEYVREVSDAVSLPVLYKDFVVDEYQIFLARKYGASAVLLMLSILTPDAYLAFRKTAESLGLYVLTEASTEDETRLAVELGADIIGINNRNLRTLKVSLDNTRNWGALIPADRITVAESGLTENSQAREMSVYADAFLVGSSLTASGDIDLEERRLVFGNNKVCGLTRASDAALAAECGAVYGGIILAEKSPRFVRDGNIDDVMAGTRESGQNLRYCAVTVNAPLEAVAGTVRKHGFSAVQLHGSETPDYIAELRKAVPEGTEIWKAVPVAGSFPEEQVRAYACADRIVLDTKNGSGFGGTGESFGTDILKGHDLSKCLIAGGLGAENCAEAAKAGAYGLDFNSRVEERPGIKSEDALRAVFARLRVY